MARGAEISQGEGRRGGQLPEELDPGHPQSTSFDGFLQELRERRRERKLAPPAPDPACALCHGRGWRIKPDGGAGRAVLCECRKENRAATLTESAGLPEKYRDLALYQFDTRHTDVKVANQLSTAAATCERYAEEFWDIDRNAPRRTGLLITGPPGTGKTHLAVATLREVIHRWQARGYFIDFTSLLKAIQMTWDDPSAASLGEITRPVLEAELLVLDELGSQRPTDWVMQNLYWVINTRYNRGLATIFTSNYWLEPPGARPAPARAPLPLDGAAVMEPMARAATDRPELLAHRISAPLLSRLYEMTQLVSLNGVPRDFRRDIMAKRRQRGD